MTRRRPLWLAVAVVLAVVVAYQAVVSSSERAAQFAAQADVPTVVPGVDVFAGVAEVPVRIRRHDYRRAALVRHGPTTTPLPVGITAVTRE